VYSYAVKSIVDLNKTEGAYLNALFWVRRLQCLLSFCRESYQSCLYTYYPVITHRRRFNVNQIIIEILRRRRRPIMQAHLGLDQLGFLFIKDVVFCCFF